MKKYLIFLMCTTLSLIARSQGTYTEYLQLLNNYTTNYPGICSIETKTSVTGKTIAFIKLSDQVQSADAKSKILLLASQHGNEKSPYLLAIRLTDYLLKNYNKNTIVTNLLFGSEIIICPVVNPDGYFDLNSRENYNGFNINRNFPYKTTQNPDGGPTQAETQAVIDIFTANNEIIACLDLHSGAEYTAFPWFGENTNASASTISLANQYYNLVQENAISTYMDDYNSPVQGWSTNPVPVGDHENEGTFTDYATFDGKFGLTIELTHDKLKTQVDDLWNYNYKSLIQYALSSCNLNISYTKETTLNNTMWQNDRYTVAGKIFIGDGYLSIDPLVSGKEKYLVASSSIQMTAGTEIDAGNYFHAMAGPTQYDNTILGGLKQADAPISSNYNEGSLKIYPTLTTGAIWVVGQDENIKNISIYNLSGQLLKQYIVGLESEYSLDISNFPDNMYLISVITDKSSYRSKIVKKGHN
jgi:hypothetical protein